MRIQAEGKICDRILAVGPASYPIYAVCGDDKTLLVDAGLSVLGPRYLKGIQALPGRRANPDLLFLTHSHYDHLGSARYLKRHLPRLVIGAHERVPALLEKDSALETMNRLGQTHADIAEGPINWEELRVASFPIELCLAGGDKFDLGGLTVQVLATPGHTRDSLSFFVPELRALFPGDACGEFKDAAATQIQVQFVSSYEEYVNSLEFLAGLEPDIVCLAHGWVLTDDDARWYMEASVAETRRYRELIERYLEASGNDVEKAVLQILHDEYDSKPGMMQNRNSYLTNLEAQVRHIAKLRASA
ncbi:MAG: MBL fold metallo-hydrolase [Thermoleophilia bacterium]|nr:MBL fold metallo-hydrolase [Thermoleophilia bacterium]